jgi:hypothetical protein
MQKKNMTPVHGLLPCGVRCCTVIPFVFFEKEKKGSRDTYSVWSKRFHVKNILLRTKARRESPLHKLGYRITVRAPLEHWIKKKTAIIGKE